MEHLTQDSTRCSSMVGSTEKHQKISQEEFYFMSMFNDISCGTKDNERECVANAKVVS